MNRMAIHPLNPPDSQLERQLWSDSRRLVIQLMLARAGGPLTVTQIARETCAAPETISQKLWGLSAMGLVMRPRVRGGWYLTRQGWQLLHPAENPPYPLVDVTIQADCSNFAEENGMDSADSGMETGEQERISSTVNHDQSADSGMETRNGGADSSATTQADSADSGKDNATDSADSDLKSAEKRGIALKEEEIESIKDSSSVLSDSSPEKHISLAELLSKSHLLFGPPGVLPNRLPERPPQLILGWLAQAYAQRARLRAPAALVYRRLLSGDLPSSPYREQPVRYLPREYLQAVNLARPSSADAEDDAPLDESEAELEEDAPDPSLLALVNGRTLLSAWQQAVSLLRAELSPANYNTYLEPTRPLSWHPPDRLVITTPDPGGRDWLASRVGRTMERMLVGILAQQVKVEFECESSPGATHF